MEHSRRGRGSGCIRSEGIEELADGVPEQVDTSGGGASEQGPELGEGLLDRVQVRTVGWEVEALGAGGLDGLPHAFDLVGGEVVHDHAIALAQGRRQRLLDVGHKAGAVDRAVEHAGR
jgi:hypothetical protein